jgi:uncharacterized protein YjbI with pentapeptide repeats
MRVDGYGKGSLLTFLHGAGLVGAENPAVSLSRADLRAANLREADLGKADLRGAIVSAEQLAVTRSLTGATMPDDS